MSDRPSPSWGPASYDDRDLDAVLSGELAGLPEPLLPVAGALAALCAAPARAELAGEAAARAMFREHAAALPVERARPAAPAGGLLHRIPPARAADDLPRPRPHSHRHRRPPGRLGGRRRWQAVALLGGGAAAAVAVAAYAGVFSGPGSQHVAAPGVAVTTARAQEPASGAAKPPILNGGGSKEPSPSPTPSASGQPGASSAQSDQAAALCREFFKLLTSSDARGSAARDDYQRLAKMADGQSVVNYCAGFGVGWGNPVYRYPSDRGWGPGGHSGYGSRGHSGFGGGR
jgi:hypothetical protein